MTGSKIFLHLAEILNNIRFGVNDWTLTSVGVGSVPGPHNMWNSLEVSPGVTVRCKTRQTQHSVFKFYRLYIVTQYLPYLLFSKQCYIHLCKYMCKIYRMGKVARMSCYTSRLREFVLIME